MKRRKTSNRSGHSDKALFFWSDARSRNRGREDGSDTEIEVVSDKPQIGLILKRGQQYNDCYPLPFELLKKIFKYVVDQSDHPLKDLSNLARVCEGWRQLILRTTCLWSRIDLTHLPITDGNVTTLKSIFDHNPAIKDNVKEVVLRGSLDCKTTRTSTFIEDLISCPNISSLSFGLLNCRNRGVLSSTIVRAIGRCTKLHSLSITDSRILFGNQKWLADYLLENGKQLEVLNLAMSINSISSQLFRSIESDYCPNLKVLDLSTCDALTTHSFDAIQLAQHLPNLRVLRVANVSFRRVFHPPENPSLKRLTELSMPIGMRDADRDDALFATLAFGSDSITTLDLRGSSITAKALIDMPSYNVKEFHMDDLCPITRRDYHQIIRKWASTLEVLSLVKINCSETVKSCLKALCEYQTSPCIREIDLSSSDITAEDLKEFLRATKRSLNQIDLSSCRSLPRGCKGRFNRNPSNKTQALSLLMKRLK